MNSARQLVLGTAVNYGRAETEIFARSLRQTGYDGDIAFLVGKISTETQKFFAEYKITAIPFAPLLLHPRWRNLWAWSAKYLSPKKTKGEAWKLYEHWLPINSARFIAYQKFLESNAAHYDEYIFADVRDVFFQKNPFDIDYGCALGFFEEAPTLTIGACAYNSGWIYDGYGHQTLKKMSPQTVICAGVSYAQAAAVEIYTQAMVRELVRTNSHRNLDQGVHNYLARHENFPGAKIFKQESSPVLNIACTPPEKIKLNERNQVLNSQDAVAAIVHQYDRHPGLTGKLLTQLS